MNKAILVLEMPNKCGECSLRMGMICTPTLKDIESVDKKMDYCPLKPLSEKEEISRYASHYKNNHCCTERE